MDDSVMKPRKKPTHQAIHQPRSRPSPSARLFGSQVLCQIQGTGSVGGLDRAMVISWGFWSGKLT